MKFALEKIDSLSGKMTTMYAVVLPNASSSVFEAFLKEYQQEFREELW